MNKFILVVMNRENHTQEELKENRDAAAVVHYDFADDAAYAYAAYAAYAYADDAADYAAYDCEYWVNRYFERTGEDKQTYIDALENKS